MPRVTYAGKCLIAGLIGACCLGRALAALADEPAPRVVLITFDGVRWNEIFTGPDAEVSAEVAAQFDDGADGAAILPYFWSQMVPAGTILGDRRSGSRVTISNPSGISIPAYQAIFGGRVTFCLRNECGRIRHETFPERLVRELALAPHEVVAFVTDAKICSALEHRPGAIFTHCGGAFEPSADSGDRSTFERALRYLQAAQPRFLYIGLDETDAVGHANDYASHLALLASYDEMLRELDGALASMGQAGRDTVVLITTDHGRGRGEEWPGHSFWVSGTSDIWLFARGPGIAARGTISGSPVSHTDIRPTIEHLFGLEPTRGLLYGHVIEDLLARPD